MYLCNLRKHILEYVFYLMSTSFRIIQSESDHVRLKTNQQIQQQRITPLTSDQWPLKADTSSAQTNAPFPSNIAAIDFGTTYSSIVFKREGDEGINNLKLNGIYERVPTAILLQVVDRPQDPYLPVKVIVKEYGYRALTEYSRLREKDCKQYICFGRIKMTMKQNQVSCQYYNKCIPTS